MDLDSVIIFKTLLLVILSDSQIFVYWLNTTILIPQELIDTMKINVSFSFSILKFILLGVFIWRLNFAPISLKELLILLAIRFGFDMFS